jgi:hypothetical protein
MFLKFKRSFFPNHPDVNPTIPPPDHSPISNMPDLVLTEIFSYINNPGSCCRVNTRWLKINYGVNSPKDWIWLQQENEVYTEAYIPLFTKDGYRFKRYSSNNQFSIDLEDAFQYDVSTRLFNGIFPETLFIKRLDGASRLIYFKWFRNILYPPGRQNRTQLLRDIAISDDGNHVTFLFQSQGYKNTCWDIFTIIEYYLNLIDMERHPLIIKTVIDNRDLNLGVYVRGPVEMFLSQDSKTITFPEAAPGCSKTNDRIKYTFSRSGA